MNGLFYYFKFGLVPLVFFKEMYCTNNIYTVCTRINYKIVSVTNLNKCLQYGTSSVGIVRSRTKATEFSF